MPALEINNVVDRVCVNQSKILNVGRVRTIRGNGDGEVDESMDESMDQWMGRWIDALAM